MPDLRHQPGRRAAAALIVGAVAAAAMTAAAPATPPTESAIDYARPVVERDAWQGFCARLGLEREQQIIADVLFSDYATSLQEIAAEADARAEAAGRSRLRDAVTGRIHLQPDEFRALRATVMLEYRPCIPWADEQFRTLLASARSLLVEEQTARLDAAERELRRRTLLHPRRRESGTREYAGDGVDLLELAAEARAEDGELAALPASALAGILADYEHRLDALLDETTADYFVARLDHRIGGIRRDRAAMGEGQRRAIEVWERLDDLNRGTVGRIAAAAEGAGGAEAADRWRRRFDEACFPWLFGPQAPDRQHDWLRRQELDEEAARRIGAAFDSYRRRRWELAREAIDIMLRARRDHRCLIHSMMRAADITDPACQRLYEQLLRNSGALTKLEGDTAEAVEAALDEDQRQAMRQAMRRSIRSSRRR
ncbi:MAG: hypothetical protein ACYTG1_10920 [Planctomycetota bacterium]|jgi:hypothetical protein